MFRSSLKCSTLPPIAHTPPPLRTANRNGSQEDVTGPRATKVGARPVRYSQYAPVRIELHEAALDLK
eukprot:367430-Rhodomonas_salina.3